MNNYLWPSSRGTGTRTPCLLVREPVSSVEQLLSGQPVVGDVAGLPADQVVRHAVRTALTGPSVKSSTYKQTTLTTCLGAHTETHAPARTPTTFSFGAASRSRSGRLPVRLLRAPSEQSGHVLMKSNRETEENRCFFGPLRLHETTAHALSAANSGTCSSPVFTEFPTLTSHPTGPPPTYLFVEQRSGGAPHY